MANIDGAPAPDDSAGAGPGPGGPPQGDGGLLTALRQQQQGPSPSVPGPGNQANSLMLLKNGIDLIQQALGGLEAGTPVHRDALNALNRLSRHLAQGAPTAGVQQTQLGDLMRMVMRSALLGNLQRQQRGQQGAGTSPQAPMPSTPLPGA